MFNYVRFTLWLTDCSLRHSPYYGQCFKTICRATSIICVRSPVCVRLIKDGRVGLGQLFRYLNKLPTFSLIDAGRTNYSYVKNDGINRSTGTLSSTLGKFHGGMWRTYELQCEEMVCLIHEEFHRDAWNISPALDDDVSVKPTM